MGGCCCCLRDDYDGSLNEPLVSDKCSTRTSSIAPTQGPLAAELRNYELLSYLGRGAFAEVTLAQHTHTRQLFAIKRISKKRVHELGFAQQTATERALLGELEHPFLVKLQQAFQNAEYLYLVLDFAPGGNLLGLIQRNLVTGSFRRSRHLAHIPVAKEGVDVTSLFFYAVEISLMLMHIHQEGYLYRDLKPENVLLGRSGHILLTDFGVARGFSKKEQYLKRYMRKKTALLTALVAEEEVASASISPLTYLEGEQRLATVMDVSSLSKAVADKLDVQRVRSYSTSTETSDNGSFHSGDSSESKRRGLSGFLGLFGPDGRPGHVQVANVSGDSFDDAWDECVVPPTEENTPEVPNQTSFVGTPNYMAPEVLGTPTEQPSTPSDWWSFGCLLFEMSTGRQAFQADNDYNLFKKVLAVEVNSHPTDFTSEDADEGHMLLLLKDLILNGLLAADPNHRLGADTIFSHPFFSCRTLLDPYGIAVAPHLGSQPDSPAIFALASPDPEQLSLCHGSRWEESIDGVTRGQVASRQHHVMYRAFSHYFVDETVRRLWDGACAKAALTARAQGHKPSLVSLSTFDSEDGVFGLDVRDVFKGRKSSDSTGPVYLERPYLDAPFVPVLASETDISHFTSPAQEPEDSNTETLFDAFDSDAHATEVMNHGSIISQSGTELSSKNNSRRESSGSVTPVTPSRSEVSRTLSRESTTHSEHNYVGFSYAGREVGILD